MKAVNLRRILLYIAVFLLCWIWDVLGHLLDVFNLEFYWMWILQTMFSPLQGFLNFLVYGLTTLILMKGCSSSKYEPLGSASGSGSYRFSNNFGDEDM
eukprot:TRINITY_DN4118_c0_g2_i1.p1 TRINITY_DN4118_c0_g2~~TRINITY_DN4118_c0_g2_i1.p1  ORF type:complete len:113 (-),score=0.43 TRINITY_DN4118_c0_g2_i1:130-423(-)